jgi:hypothetical protein
MRRIFLKIKNKLIFEFIFKKWIIGICRDSIEDIIRNKTFDPDITWISKKTFNKFYADPFHVIAENGSFKILVEDFTFDDDYGKIALLTFDKNFKQTNHKILLDTKSHLSYPFVFKEQNKTYVFPESKQNERLSCYEFDPEQESLNFIHDILNLPLLDSTILKHDDKYWIFGTIRGNDNDYNLNIYYSDNFLGKYTPHPKNPVKSGLNGTRSAGNFIEIDGILYRPSQNCLRDYGESITINKVTELNEINFNEERYMNVCINRKNKYNRGVHTIHTINVLDDVILVDGVNWLFSPLRQFKRNHRRMRKSNR